MSSTTITIGWRDPENLNGAIVGYRVFYINQNQTYFATVRSGTGADEMIRYSLCDLSKYAGIERVFSIGYMQHFAFQSPQICFILAIQFSNEVPFLSFIER